MDIYRFTMPSCKMGSWLAICSFLLKVLLKTQQNKLVLGSGGFCTFGLPVGCFFLDLGTVSIPLKGFLTSLSALSTELFLVLVELPGAIPDGWSEQGEFSFLFALRFALKNAPKNSRFVLQNAQKDSTLDPIPWPVVKGTGHGCLGWDMSSSHEKWILFLKN